MNKKNIMSWSVAVLAVCGAASVFQKDTPASDIALPSPAQTMAGQKVVIPKPDLPVTVVPAASAVVSPNDPAALSEFARKMEERESAAWTNDQGEYHSANMPLRMNRLLQSNSNYLGLTHYPDAQILLADTAKSDAQCQVVATASFTINSERLEYSSSGKRQPCAAILGDTKNPTAVHDVVGMAMNKEAGSVYGRSTEDVIAVINNMPSVLMVVGIVMYPNTQLPGRPLTTTRTLMCRSEGTLLNSSTTFKCGLQ